MKKDNLEIREYDLGWKAVVIKNNDTGMYDFYIRKEGYGGMHYCFGMDKKYVDNEELQAQVCDDYIGMAAEERLALEDYYNDKLSKEESND